MKKADKKHWYDSIIRPFSEERKDEPDNVSRRSQASSLPTPALPMIEEWASSEDYAA